MKKLTIVFLLGFTAGLWGQEAKKPYPQGLIGIHSRFGAASVRSSLIGQNYTIPINTILFELVPTKRDKRGSALLLSFRLMQPFTTTPASLNREPGAVGAFWHVPLRWGYRPMFNILYWGFLIGGSTELYAQNKATGLGWNVLLNGGIFTDVPITIAAVDVWYGSGAPYWLNLGAEIDLKTVYRFGRYSAFSMGLNLGYTWRINPIGERARPKSSGDHAFVYGFNIGFIF